MRFRMILQLCMTLALCFFGSQGAFDLLQRSY
ncbi:MAG: hypothetical protein RL137_1293 [Bacteroidota bacterium]